MYETHSFLSLVSQRVGCLPTFQDYVPPHHLYKLRLSVVQPGYTRKNDMHTRNQIKTSNSDKTNSPSHNSLEASKANLLSVKANKRPASSPRPPPGCFRYVSATAAPASSESVPLAVAAVASTTSSSASTNPADKNSSSHTHTYKHGKNIIWDQEDVHTHSDCNKLVTGLWRTKPSLHFGYFASKMFVAQPNRSR